MNVHNILTGEECKDLAFEILDASLDGKLHKETDERYYKNSYGSQLPSHWKLFDKFTEDVSELVGKKLKPANPYCRIYNHESTLNPHTDRDGLDWTLSICVFDNTDVVWPLQVETEDDTYGYIIKVGNGAIMNGTKYKHWRDPLNCGYGKMAIYIFLHWVEVND